MNAAAEQMGSGSMSKVMDPDAWEARLVERTREPFCRPGSIGRASKSRREYQAGVVPVGTCGELVLDLAPAGSRSRRPHLKAAEP